VAGAGLYVHVPFCSAVCPYCDFAVHTGNAAAREAFTDSLIRELKLWPEWDAPIDTVYFGGGTPSALSGSQLNRIIDAASAALPLARDARLHFEANPEDVTPDAIAQWQAMGVQMLSLGIQSFDEAELKQLGRRHTGSEAQRALQACLDADFHTVSCDLIFGLPGQSRTTLEANLAVIEALSPQHVSCYQLTIHQGTTFWKWRERGRLHELDEDSQADLYVLLSDRLQAQGLAAYEVSNFACDATHESQHNRKYWDHTPYLGVGPSAHSFSGSRRWWNHRATGTWAAALERDQQPVAGDESLSPSALALETLMLRLRTRDGLDMAAFGTRFGIDLSKRNTALLADLLARKLVTIEGTWLRPTRTGLGVSDGIVAMFDL
jgi:oxygen-independent coproporphyrinogen-3 oxidase